MRMQISFEAMVYFALAGFALLFGLAMLASKWQYVNNTMETYSISHFVNTINMNIAYGTHAFSIYVPYGACNSTIALNEMTTAYGTFYFLDLVRVSKSVFCPGNAYANLTVSYVNSTWVIAG